MYKVEYSNKEKDLTYDEAFCSAINNENTKWVNYYAYLKEKNDLCYNVDSVTIDVDDIKNMKYDCYSNNVLLKLYLMCKNNQVFDKYEQVTIPNNSVFMEEVIYNIFKSDWLINEELIHLDNDELLRRKNYFKIMIDVSEDSKDIKIQFRNKLFDYFIKTYDSISKQKYVHEESKILKLEKNKTN